MGVRGGGIITGQLAGHPSWPDCKKSNLCSYAGVRAWRFTFIARAPTPFITLDSSSAALLARLGSADYGGFADYVGSTDYVGSADYVGSTDYVGSADYVRLCGLRKVLRTM